MTGRLWLAPALVTAGIVCIGFLFGSPELREGWFLCIVTLAGLCVASLGLLMIGHLLGDRWLAPIRDELEPASWTIPAIAALALPLSLGFAELYPWVETPALLPPARREWLTIDWFTLRAAFYLMTWSALAWVVSHSGQHLMVSGIGLALLASTFSLATIDWVMSREPYWWSSLFGFAFAVSQIMAALAVAILVTVARQSRPPSEEMISLERALLTLALLTAWVWFAQFLVVWMANLPGEARWYVERMHGGWGWLKLAVVIPALAAAIFLLLMPARAQGWRILTACALLLVHHIAHMIWLIRPVEHAPPPSLADVTAVLAVGVAWLLWFAAGLERRQTIETATSGPGRSRG